MNTELVTVECLVASRKAKEHILTEVWGLALDQRAFGPRRLVVVCTDGKGWLRTITHCPRLTTPERGLDPCLQMARRRQGRHRLVSAVALCDEPVVAEAPLHELDAIRARFVDAQSRAWVHGFKLLDWIACDDDQFRSFRVAGGEAPWWVEGPGLPDKPPEPDWH